MTYEQAKDQIANQENYVTWSAFESVHFYGTIKWRECSGKAAELYADSVARDAWQHDDLVMLKDLYNACCKYEKERQGLMSWEIPSLHRAKQILSRKYPDMTFDEDGRLIYRP